MTDEEILLRLCEALEKLECVEPYSSSNEDLLEAVRELVKEVRDELRYGRGEM